jgi:hypothetical protein
MTDHRIPADQLTQQLADAGFTVTWPPEDYSGWRDIARRLAHGEPPPPRPGVYDPAVLRAIHAVDPELGRAVMRAGAGWLQAPHGDGDFDTTLSAWEAGLCLGAIEGEPHWVAAQDAAFARVDVARCKDCGLPVYGRGGGDWQPIWPPASRRRTLI